VKVVGAGKHRASGYLMGAEIFFEIRRPVRVSAL